MKGIDLKVYGTAPNGALLVSADEVNTGVQSLIDENNQLKQRNAELEAQVELLQDFLAQAKKFNPEITVPEFLMRTGQCLAEVKAQAVEDALSAVEHYALVPDTTLVCINALRKYANTICNRKGGE